MLGSNDYLRQKASELDLARGDFLEAVQRLLEQWYPGTVRAVSFNKGTLRLVTPNASVAGELRLRQVELLEAIKEPVERLQINIG